MVDPAHVDLFKTRLQEAVPHDALLTLARELRDCGSSQLDLYCIFSCFQQRLSPEDPRYDAIVDTMDLIWSGERAKGSGLFSSALDEASVQVDRVAPPAPWVAIGVSGHVGLEQELAREVGPGHVLADRAGRALMRADGDDVLFAVRRSPEVALVHLTWSGSREPPGFPSTLLFASMLDWYEDVEAAESE